MSIRFACEHCGQPLRVSSSKAGKRAKCPKCQGVIRVPAQSPDEEVSEVSREGRAAEGPRFSEFVVFDDDPGWTYADDRGDYSDSGDIDPHRISLPRSVLYVQGVLLGVVAIACFVFGIYLGRQTARPVEEVPAGPRPCVVEGTVRYRNSNQDEVPDDGSVVVVLPQGARPDGLDKLPVDRLRPEDEAPDRTHPTLMAIHSLGGDYVRADTNGKFRLQVPDVGKYYVLVISRNSRRREPLDKNHLAQIGRYFLPAEVLLGEARYDWREENVRRDKLLHVVF